MSNKSCPLQKNAQSMFNVCRTCLCERDVLPLFPQPDNYHNFERALYLSTGLRIQVNDGLPQSICRKCASTVEGTMRFRATSHLTEKKLLKYFKLINKTDQEKKALGEKRNQNNETIEVKVEDFVKNEMKLEEKTVVETLLSVNKSNEADYTQAIDYSDEEFNFSDKKTDQEKKALEEKRNQNNETIEVKVEDFVNEMKLEEKTVVETLLSVNKSNEADYTQAIDYSDEEFNFSDHRTEILSDNENESITKTKHSNSRPYLDLIEGPINNKGPVVCKVCKKSSKCINSFEKHAMSHMGYEILCEFCARRCVSRMQLLRHQRAKHGLARDNSFACKYCDYKAIDKEQLESHERRLHTKERPFVCDECGEAFYTKRVLIQHGYRHKTDKPFQCNMCPSKFKIRSRLTSHKNFVHSKRYKYSYGCYLCPKVYKKPFEARKHIVKIHGIPKDQQNKIPRYNREDT